MFELISVGISVWIIVGLVLWGYVCCLVREVRTRQVARPRLCARRQIFARVPLIFLILAAATTTSFSQTVTSSVMPAAPTYVDTLSLLSTASAGDAKRFESVYEG